MGHDPTVTGCAIDLPLIFFGVGFREPETSGGNRGVWDHDPLLMKSAGLERLLPIGLEPISRSGWGGRS